MATTDLKSIVDAWQVVLAASPFSLKAAPEPFSFDRVPNSLIGGSYYIADGGQISRTSQTNYVEARIDRLEVWISKPLNFAGVAQFEALLQLSDTLYRYLSADGRTNGWNVEQDGHDVRQVKGADLIVGRFSFKVDYDFSSAV